MKNKIKVLEMIAKNMENDAKELDGMPFNGKIVAEYFGNQGAAIAAIGEYYKRIIKGKIMTDQEILDNLESLNAPLPTLYQISTWSERMRSDAKKWFYQLGPKPDFMRTYERDL
ncbi:hypothetical protein H8E88_19355 [candidate division KSB1 bacterium]|nr:hypothetical protein [candidate division KSB1 bacterium]